MHGLDAILGSNKSPFFFGHRVAQLLLGALASHPSNRTPATAVPNDAKIYMYSISILFAFIYFFYLGLYGDTKEFEAVHSGQLIESFLFPAEEE